MSREIARFIQSRFGGLKISEAKYEDLLSEADEHYPKYLEHLKQDNPITISIPVIWKTELGDVN
jgi:intergrase/recombinase